MTSLPCLLAAVLCSSLQNPVPYDGNWWRSTNREERTGFLAGYGDCDLYDVGHAQRAGIAWNAMESRITEYYEKHASERNAPVTSIFGKIAAHWELRPLAGGEEHPEKHGIFDGQYWREATAQHRLGFIKGYLECRRIEGKPAGGYSQSAGWYVARISQWYGLTADDGADWGRIPEKIANVLQLLRRPDRE